MSTPNTQKPSGCKMGPRNRSGWKTWPGNGTGWPTGLGNGTGYRMGDRTGNETGNPWQLGLGSTGTAQESAEAQSSSETSAVRATGMRKRPSETMNPSGPKRWPQKRPIPQWEPQKGHQQEESQMAAEDQKTDPNAAKKDWPEAHSSSNAVSIFTLFRRESTRRRLQFGSTRVMLMGGTHRQWKPQDQRQRRRPYTPTKTGSSSQH